MVESNESLPEYFTLAEVKEHFYQSTLGMSLDAITAKNGKYPRIKFLDRNDKEFPDTMTIGDFRVLVAKGLGHIVIDESDGGLPVAPERPKVLM